MSLFKVAPPSERELIVLNINSVTLECMKWTINLCVGNPFYRHETWLAFLLPSAIPCFLPPGICWEMRMKGCHVTNVLRPESSRPAWFKRECKTLCQVQYSCDCCTMRNSEHAASSFFNLIVKVHFPSQCKSLEVPVERRPSSFQRFSKYSLLLCPWKCGEIVQRKWARWWPIGQSWLWRKRCETTPSRDQSFVSD